MVKLHQLIWLWTNKIAKGSVKISGENKPSTFRSGWVKYVFLFIGFKYYAWNDFFSSSNLIFTACVACKNQFSNQIDFLNLIFWNWKKIKWHLIFQKSSGDRQGDCLLFRRFFWFEDRTVTGYSIWDRLRNFFTQIYLNFFVSS